MKLKYYLRGIGIGVILTALIMGFALGGRKATISDAEVIERAKELGMVQGGVLSDYSGEGESIEDTSVTSSTVQTEAVERKETSEKNDSELSIPSSPIPQTDKEDTKEADKTKDEAKAEEPSKEESKPAKEVNTSDSDKTQAKAEAPQESEEPAAEAPSEEASDSSFVNAAKTVTIPGGLSSDGVAQILYNEGIIDNPSSFNKYLIDRGVDRVIRSGTKDFPEGATYEQIASIITH